MYQRVYSVSLSIIFLILLSVGCTKLDTSPIGSELIPTVDNINTFADTIDVNSSQGFFNDSSLVSVNDNFALGHISDDPLFGKTDANVFLQFKPQFFPFHFGNSGDTLLSAMPDSVVLCLSYTGSWGDTLAPQTLEVRKIEDGYFRDSVYLQKRINYAPNVGELLGSTNIYIPDLEIKKYIYKGKVLDSVTNQIRIPITNSVFLQQLFDRDTASVSLKNSFRNDSLFRQFLNGIAIISKPMSGNGLMYINALGANTRMEIHYKVKHLNGGGVVDTLRTDYTFQSTNNSFFPSAFANNIIRNRTGSASASPSTDFNYLQTSPGSYINIDVPRFNTFRDTNRVVHRAYLAITQAPDNTVSDSLFTPPVYLYLDIKDTTGSNIWKPIYKDLSFSFSYNPDLAANFFPGVYTGSPQIDFLYFGNILNYKTVEANSNIAFYNINITKYLQHLITTQKTNYQLRLYAPNKITYPQYTNFSIPIANQFALGRLKIGSGANPNSNYKMKIVVIWSKI